jgi:hypothetical protein
MIQDLHLMHKILSVKGIKQKQRAKILFELHELTASNMEFLVQSFFLMQMEMLNPLQKEKMEKPDQPM